MIFVTSPKSKLAHSCRPAMMNYYIYLHIHKVLNNNSNKLDIDNCNCHNKGTYPLPNKHQTRSIIHQTKNVTLLPLEQHLKDASGFIKYHSITLDVRMIWNYQNSFWESQNSIQHLKSFKKWSEHAILTIQRLCAAFYV